MLAADTARTSNAAKIARRGSASANEGSTQVLAALGAYRLAAQRSVGESSPTVRRAFAEALVRCLQAHPAARSARGLPGGDRLVAIDACGLVARLCEDPNQRLRLVFLGSEHAAAGADNPPSPRRAPSTIGEDEKKDLDEALGPVWRDAKMGCVPALVLLAAAPHDPATSDAAVAALRVVVENSTTCREALVAYDGVRALVGAAARGGARLRKDVTEIVADLALAPATRRALMQNSSAMLLLLKFKVRGQSAGDEDAESTAHAERALRTLHATPALVYRTALETCVARVDAWSRLGRFEKAANPRDALTATVGLALLRPGIDELLQLVCRGLEAESRHAGAADALLRHHTLRLLLRCLRVRDAAVVASVSGALAALLQRVGAREARLKPDEVEAVADAILSLVWPLSHRAARAVQHLFRARRDGARSRPRAALVPVTPRLVGVLALALERADLDLGLGGYLVRSGALGALAARITPDWHRQDETFLDGSETGRGLYGGMGAGDRNAACNRERASTAAGPRQLPPVVQVLSAFAQLATHAPKGAPYGPRERTLRGNRANDQV